MFNKSIKKIMLLNKNQKDTNKLTIQIILSLIKNKNLSSNLYKKNKFVCSFTGFYT